MNVAGAAGSLAEKVRERLRGTVSDGFVYLPKHQGAAQPGPDLEDARQAFATHAPRGGRAVLLSSAEAYGSHHSNPGMMDESRAPVTPENRVQAAWLKYEEMARQAIPAESLTILRAAPTLTRDGRDFFSEVFRSSAALALPGSASLLQLLHPDDTAEAIRAAASSPSRGLFNVAPASILPFREALALAGVTRIPAPRLLQEALRPLVPGAWSGDQLQYLRYNWTVSGRRAQRELGFTPKYTTAQAIDPSSQRQFDPYGMDPDYIRNWGQTGFKFLRDLYWRVEARGFDNIPREGRAVLTGVHRGFMPFDATMILDMCVQHRGRAPRFLIHPCLVKMPPLNNAMTRWGGLVANQENAEWVLEREGLLAIYPEGIRGAFRMYKEAYTLAKFGRDDYIRIALRHRAPIIPFVTVGHAEIYPILGRINIAAFNRWTEWPFNPITPTWPLIPLPLPSKWHVEFLPPIHLEREYPADAADDLKLVKQLGVRVRSHMQQALTSLVERRQHIFWGQIFPGERPMPTGAVT